MIIQVEDFKNIKHKGGKPISLSTYNKRDSNDICMNQLCKLLCYLRGLSISYQNMHWTTKGSHFYGSHLLFERLYDEVNNDLDILGEKFVAFYNCNLSKLQNLKHVQQFMNKCLIDDCPYKCAIIAEECFRGEISNTYDLFKQQGVLTLGLDDFLMSLDNKHENNLYLLLQTIR